MGRSVEVRSDALVTAYAEWVPSYEEYIDSIGWVEEDPMPEEDEYYTYMSGDIWEDAFEWFKEDIIREYPSLWATDRWAEYPWRETHIVAENNLIEISVSDYCGLTAISISPKDGVAYDGMEGLAVQVATRMRERFLKLYSSYYQVARMGDGTAIYEKVSD